MQAGGRRGDGNLAGPIGVNGLVAFDIACAFGGIFALNIRRQRDITEAIGDFDDGLAGRRGKFHGRRTVGLFADHFSAEGAIGMRESRADGEAFTGLDQAAPDLFSIDGAEEKALDLATCGSRGLEPSGEHGGVVAEEGVALIEELREISEDVVADLTRRSIHDEEARGITTGGRSLRDEMIG